MCGPDGDDDDYEYDDHDEYAYVVRKLMLSLKNVDDTQCHKLFRTRCTVQGGVCLISSSIVAAKRTS